MAAPGIKVSELTQFAESTEDKLNQQKFLVAYNGKNYQTPLTTLSSKFIIRDFAASETNHLSGSWNWHNTTGGVGVCANDPVFPIDVANGNTLSDLQNIFDRFPNIWRIRIPFINKYEPKIDSVYRGTTWLIRDKHAEPVDRGEFYNVSVKDSAWRYFPDEGVNKISLEGGYVFLKSENKNKIRRNIYMSVGDEYTDEILRDLGWDDTKRTPITVRRFQILPTSKLGVTFHCAYKSIGTDENYAKNHDFDYAGTVTVKYAGTRETGDIRYFGGPKIHTEDNSPHRDNHHWGEGDPHWPDIRGGEWKKHKTDHLEILGSTGTPGWHGVFMEVYDYEVEVLIHDVTISDE